MLRHEFRPGRLIAGTALLGAGVLFAGDATDAWNVAWFVLIPIVVGGLCLAGATASIGHLVRRARRQHQAEPPGAGDGAHDDHPQDSHAR